MNTQNKYVRITSFVILLAISISLIVMLRTPNAYVVLNEGCCESTCSQTPQNSCPGNFQRNRECSSLDECNIGCCIDTEGYCLSNYLKGNCFIEGGEFISRYECMQYPLCITEISDTSLQQYTGYPEIYPPLSNGIALVEPFAEERETMFTIRFAAFREMQSVRAELSATGFSKNLALYDDGMHSDLNPDDLIYAGIFDSTVFPASASVNKVNYRIFADNVESMSSYFIIAEDKCFPKKPWHENVAERTDVFLMTSSNFMAFKKQVKRLTESFEYIEGFQNLNYYSVNQPYNVLSDSQLESKLQQHCTFYKQNQDYIIVFEDRPGCSQNLNIIRTNPKLLVKKNEITNIGQFLNDFCSLVVTEDELDEYLLEAMLPPQITLISPSDGDSFTSNDIDVSFEITDNKDSNFHYRIYMDASATETLLAEGDANAGEVITETVNMHDSLHSLWVEAEDSDSNTGYSDPIEIDVNANNFIVHMQDFTEDIYMVSPDIVFSISHAGEPALNYEVIVDGSLLESGTINNGEVKTLTTNLGTGQHFIGVKAYDSSGLKTRSFPYTIYIENEQTT